MYEQRRSKRISVSLELKVSSIFKQDNIWLEELNAEIEVTDISRTGIGFKSISKLPVGYYFNAKLELGSKENILYCVVKIIREVITNKDNYIMYGCEFVGMPSILFYIFDEFEEKIKEY